ncbi:double-CXXCG motif protein [Myxococcus sp. K15C18031901]|uniref:SitI6 family double-CXXCG motif immunity protein n=1 Tax=Myxococcus dinghuensis TaxID=2906761 RepID=UPI0020A7C715|nr:double-CXXCG motif protein [Myxococcus dinghuensis]MCP3101733.1 double-CXXCG motif protein [Myxococcus dinghuensis]
MRYYELDPIFDASATRWRWNLDAKRRWGLPGTECPRCHAAPLAIALNYPRVDLTGLPEEREYRKPRLSPWGEYVRLRDRVLPLLPPGAVVEPGIGMGPLVGRVRGRPSPIAMDVAWHFFAQPEGVERLLAAGLRGINPVPTATKSARDVPPLLELELQLGGDYLPECRPVPEGEPCPVCGFQPMSDSLVDAEWLDASAMPAADVFRFRWAPSMTVASERFVEVLRGMGDTGIQVKELAVGRPAEAGATM